MSGKLTRKASEEEAEAMQVAQAQAAQRRLRRRLRRLVDEGYEEYRYFLQACMADVSHVEARVAAA